MNLDVEVQMRTTAPAVAETLDRRALLFGAGTVAVGGLLIGRTGGGDSPAAALVEELRLYASDLRHSIPGVEPGDLPPAGAPAVPHGRLTDANGAPAGTLASVSVPSTQGTAVLHTFTLVDGTILGIGPADVAGPHAVVGGGGRYAGAHGTYTVRAHDDGHVVILSLRKGIR